MSSGVILPCDPWLGEIDCCFLLVLLTSNWFQIPAGRIAFLRVSKKISVSTRSEFDEASGRVVTLIPFETPKKAIPRRSGETSA